MNILIVIRQIGVTQENKVCPIYMHAVLFGCCYIFSYKWINSTEWFTVYSMAVSLSLGNLMIATNGMIAPVSVKQPWRILEQPWNRNKNTTRGERGAYFLRYNACQSLFYMLTHCGLVTPDGGTNLGQHCLR